MPPRSVLALSGASLREFLEAVLERGVPFRFTARGFSMHPFIRDSDVITVAPLASTGPRVGEVVALRHGDRLVVHRLVRATAGGYESRGDNCPLSDGYVPAADVLGVVVRMERAGRPARLGIGREGALLARLSRAGALRPLTSLAHAPRRAAGRALRRAQRAPACRRALRRLRPALAPAFVVERARPAGVAEPAPLSTRRSFVGHQDLPDLKLWDTLKERRRPISFDLELTARCNNDCRHCYINLPAGDRAAQAAELNIDEILALAGEAADMGALWCLLTGGEPLLRDDFADIYIGLKRLGLLVSVFTNACLVTPEHVDLFRRYPPRAIEVSVYGATRETYEAVTRRPGSYDAFVRGLDLLLAGGLKVTLKAMALRSTAHELDAIAEFCRARTHNDYRFDPLLHLRFDGDEARNAGIVAERLSPEEVVAVERADDARFGALQKGCRDGKLITPEAGHYGCDHLFHCGAGNGSFSLGYDGTFRLCSSLWHPETIVSVRPGAPGAVTLREAWEEQVPKVRDLRGTDPGFLEKCRRCDIVNLCLWCPAHAALETGAMDAWVEYFCAVAHARAAALQGEAPAAPEGDRCATAESDTSAAPGGDPQQ